jgi:hypothetical protein
VRLLNPLSSGIGGLRISEQQWLNGLSVGPFALRWRKMIKTPGNMRLGGKKHGRWQCYSHGCDLRQKRGSQMNKEI